MKLNQSKNYKVAQVCDWNVLLKVASWRCIEHSTFDHIFCNVCQDFHQKICHTCIWNWIAKKSNPRPLGTFVQSRTASCGLQVPKNRLDFPMSAKTFMDKTSKTKSEMKWCNWRLRDTRFFLKGLCNQSTKKYRVISKNNTNRTLSELDRLGYNCNGFEGWFFCACIWHKL